MLRRCIVAVLLPFIAWPVVSTIAIWSFIFIVFH